MDIYAPNYREVWREKVQLNAVLTLNLLTTTIVAPPSNASKWQMGFNSAFKGLNLAEERERERERVERSAWCSTRLICREEYLATHWIGGLVGPRTRSRHFVAGKK
jgi:hypothetical protein